MYDTDTKSQCLELRAKGLRTENLYRLSALLRSEIRKACLASLPVEEVMAAEE